MNLNDLFVVTKSYCGSFCYSSFREIKEQKFISYWHAYYSLYECNLCIKSRKKKCLCKDELF